MSTQKKKNMDVRELTNIMRNLRKQTILENDEMIVGNNELTPEEVKSEEENFEKAVPDGIVQLTSVSKVGKTLNLNGNISLGEDVISFTFKLDGASIMTKYLPLTPMNVKVLNDITNYYDSWRENWTQTLNISNNTNQEIGKEQAA
jgi:hypothetical protein